MSELDPNNLDDAEAPWNRNPAERLPEVITPGRISVELWRIFDNEPTQFDFDFDWDGRRKASWRYDIGMNSPGLSPASSSPITGDVSWGPSGDATITYCSTDFDLDGRRKLTGIAPADDALSISQTWVDLADVIADFIDDILSGGHRTER